MHTKTQTYLKNVIEVLDELRTHWPLTLRQTYYQLVAAGLVENNRNEYQKLSRVLSKARLSGDVPWTALEDRSRTHLNSAGWQDADNFKQYEVEDFLEGYRRDLLQSQSARPEIWVEKDALSRIIHEVARPYCIPVIVARGFSSMSFKNECRNRVVRNANNKQRTVILYFGDLDPSGWEMLPAMMDTLHRDMEMPEDIVSGFRYALTPEQVDHYRLPINPDALKDTDSRAKKYRKRFGSLAVELDALRPDLLQDIVQKAIEENLDLSRFKEEQQIEQQEVSRLSVIKQHIEHVLDEVRQ